LNDLRINDQIEQDGLLSKLNDFFVNVVVACLFSFPGSAVLLLLKKRRGILLLNSDIVILGALLWNFLLVVPSIFTGLFSSYITMYFNIFTDPRKFTIFSKNAVIVLDELAKAEKTEVERIVWK
jgi:hypothetical protein